MSRDYSNSRVVIIGLGITGLSCVKFFLCRGVEPKVIDTRLSPPEIKNLPSFIKCSFGELNEMWIFGATLIIISPGIRTDHPVLIEAIKLGIEIIGDIELFIREVTVPIVAITGSNGKSTVTHLIGEIAKRAGWRVGVVGNIGIPALTLLHKKYQLYVLEISSFQLDTTYSLQAAVATVLNISEDHMDRYLGGLRQYHLSKTKIYHNATNCIVNISDPLTMPLSSNYKRLITVGVNSNSSADYCLEYYQGCIWLVAYNERLINCSELQISSCISYVNMLFALAISDSIRIPRFVSLKVLKRFIELSHRFQLVYKNRDISWINDSKATNVDATKKAIHNTMLVLSGRLHLLLGGNSKSADFSILKYLIKQYEIHIYCFGKDRIFLSKLGFKDIIVTDNMINAICIISRRIQRHDIVLLSPACSSLDQFSSFKSRGYIFTYLARAIG